MSRITTPQYLDDFRTELIDRFGVFPQALQRMLDRVALKIEAAVWQIHTILESRADLRGWPTLGKDLAPIRSLPRAELEVDQLC